MTPSSQVPESRLRPLPATLPVSEARDAYLAENGFGMAVYDDPWTPVSMAGIDFKVPNTARHRWAIMRHDLHRAASGYGSDLYGEIEVSAWEARRGLRPLGLYVGTIVFSLVVLGGLVAPRRTWRAWQAGAGRGSLFHDARDYDTLVALSLGALREGLGLPCDGLSKTPRRLNPKAPGAVPADPEEAAPGIAMNLLLQVAILLGGLAAYLFLSQTGSGRDDGYAFVIAIHLALLALGCAAVSLRMFIRRRSGSH